MASINRRIQRTGIAKKAKEVRVETKAAAKEKMGAARTPNETDEPLSPDVEARLSEIVARVVSLHRKSTSQIFALGECLAEAKSVQPEKRFGRWLKDNCGYSVRSAWNFISVHERLADHRERLEKHAVALTALIELAKAMPDQIETVLDLYDEGKSLKPAEIKALVGGKKDDGAEEHCDPRQLGGKSGLQKMAAAKLKSDIDEFYRLATLVLTQLEHAISRVTAGKRMIMRSLASEVELHARHASDRFKDIAAPLQPVAHLPRGNLSHGKIEEQTGWGAVQRSLYRLGGADSWPVRDEMEKWVIEVAHPALRFAVHGETYVVRANAATSPVVEVAKTDSDVTENEQIAAEKEVKADETIPAISDDQMDATLQSLVAVGKTATEARISQ